MSYVECWVLSNVSTNISFAIFMVTMWCKSGSLFRSTHGIAKSNLATYIKLCKNAQLFHTYSEYGNCSVRQKNEQLLAFDEVHPQKPKLNIELSGKDL